MDSLSQREHGLSHGLEMFSLSSHKVYHGILHRFVFRSFIDICLYRLIGKVFVKERDVIGLVRFVIIIDQGVNSFTYPFEYFQQSNVDGK